MNRLQPTAMGLLRVALFAGLSLAILPVAGRAQDEAPVNVAEEDSTREAASPADTTKEIYSNELLGQFSPGAGFDILRTKRGSLNISVYGLFRYVNQLPATQTFTDHLGRERDGQDEQHDQLAPNLRVADRLLLRPEIPVQHLSLVASDNATDAPVRKSALHRQQADGVWRRPRTQPDRPIDAGILALLGIERPPDGGGVLPRRILVLVLDHGRGDAALLVYGFGDEQSEPARRHRGQRHPEHGLQRQRVDDAHDGRVGASRRDGRPRVPSRSSPPGSARPRRTAARAATRS